VTHHACALDVSAEDRGAAISLGFSWLVFGLTIGLLLSDYMSRQVINAIFPLLKAEWRLTDRELGFLAGVVPLMVGLLTVPLSLLSDRLGRARSVVLMATLWCLATVASGLAEGYGQMLAARVVIGVGEAAYGSVGLAVIFSVFPVRMRSTLSGLYGGAALLGAVIGLALGGKIAATLGWRNAFHAVAIFGFVLVGLFALIVREDKLGANRSTAARARVADMSWREIFAALFKTRSVVFTYLGSGAQLMITGAMIAWLPTFFARYYTLPTDKAAGLAALFILASGVGMGVLGGVADRVSRRRRDLKLACCIAYCLASLVIMLIAFRLPPGPAQLVALAMGIFVAAGTWGPTTAVVANLTPPAIHATSMGVLALLNNMLGLFPGPFLTGVLSDRFGLMEALRVIPLMSLVATAMLFIAWRHYERDHRRIGEAA